MFIHSIISSNILRFGKLMVLYGAIPYSSKSLPPLVSYCHPIGIPSYTYERKRTESKSAYAHILIIVPYTIYLTPISAAMTVIQSGHTCIHPYSIQTFYIYLKPFTLTHAQLLNGLHLIKELVCQNEMTDTACFVRQQSFHYTIGSRVDTALLPAHQK